MKNEYDFSKAEKGKFYRSDIDLQLPIYLDPENNDFFSKLASSKNEEVSKIVNRILKENIKISKDLSV